MSSMTKNRLFFALLFAFSVIVGFYTLNIFSPNSPQTPLSQAIHLKENCHGPKSTRDNCYIRELFSLTLKRDSDFAFETIHALQKKEPDFSYSCHILAHSVGRALYKKDSSNWREALRKVTKECNYGAIHGIAEGYASDGGVLDKKVIPTLCMRDDGCNHGIGHVLLVQTENDLPKSLSLCDAFAKESKEAHWCLTGVFMEKMTMQSIAEHTKVPSARINKWYTYLPEFEKMCDSFSDAAYIACWTELVHPATIVYRGDPKKIFDLCNSATAQKAANSCRRHAIGDILQRNNFDLDSYKYMCTMYPVYDPEFEKECYLTIASFSSLSLKKSERGRIVEYCNNLDPQYKASCFERMRSSLTKQLSVSVEDVQVLCQQTSAANAKSCIGSL